MIRVIAFRLLFHTINGLSEFSPKLLPTEDDIIYQKYRKKSTYPLTTKIKLSSF
jgi:hypothetical protein